MTKRNRGEDDRSGGEEDPWADLVSFLKVSAEDEETSLKPPGALSPKHRRALVGALLDEIDAEHAETLARLSER